MEDINQRLDKADARLAALEAFTKGLPVDPASIDSRLIKVEAEMAKMGALLKSLGAALNA
jgi:hypothetical protein